MFRRDTGCRKNKPGRHPVRQELTPGMPDVLHGVPHETPSFPLYDKATVLIARTSGSVATSSHLRKGVPGLP